MDAQPPVHLTPTDFIRSVLLGDLERMVYEAKLHYLAFGTIAVGIEFLGACEDAYPFNEEHHSRSRFELGMERMARIDQRYSKYNQKKTSPFYLYKFLRCGTAHMMRPDGPILFSDREKDDGGPEQHLEAPKGKLWLVCEDFYDHFAQSCETLIQELPGMTAPKLKNHYLWVGDVK
jgi:hypothetical protein